MMYDDTSHITDGELLERMQQDDQRAFEQIYNRYASPLYASAYNLLRNKEVCEDLVQELFINFWSRRHSLRIHSLQAYLYKSVRNSVLMYVRSVRTHLDMAAIENNIAMLYSPEGRLLEKEVGVALQRSMEQLPDKCREIFYLSRKQQLSNKEIATLLHISPKTVENQITIALRRIKGVMREMFILLFILSLFLFGGG